MQTLFDILAVKLAAIDHQCEALARRQVDDLYASARYEGGGFRYPAFEEATKIWIRLIEQKEKLFCEEIARVFNIANQIPEHNFINDATTLINSYFDERHFAGRLNLFFDSLARKAQSYGVHLDPAEKRLDLAAAAYNVGVKNLIQKTRITVIAELTLHIGTNKKSPDWKSKLLTINESIELKPNFMGLGVNFNAIIDKLFRRSPKKENARISNKRTPDPLLEELYLLTESWTKILVIHYLPYIKVMRGEISYNQALDQTIKLETNKVDFDRLQMIIDLHYPEFRPAFTNLLQARDAASSIMMEHKKSYKNGRDGRRFIDPLIDTLNHIERSGDSLKKMIAEKVNAPS